MLGGCWRCFGLVSWDLSGVSSCPCRLVLVVFLPVEPDSCRQCHFLSSEAPEMLGRVSKSGPCNS